MAPLILTASANVSLEPIGVESDRPVLLEFIVLPPRSFFFSRSNPVKYKSPPLSHIHHWNATLAMDAESRVLLRLRIPSSQGKDRKSVSLDVSATAFSQQQSLSLSCRVGAKTVQAKVLLTLSEAAGVVTARCGLAQPEGAAADQAAAEVSGATIQPYGPSEPDAEATYMDFQASEISERETQTARMSPAVSAAESGLGLPHQQQEQQQELQQQPTAQTPPAQNKRPWWSLAGLLSFSRTSSGTTTATTAAALPRSSSEQLDASVAPPAITLPPQPSAGSLRRLITAAGAGMNGLRGQSAPCSAAPSPRSSGAGRDPTADSTLLMLEGSSSRAGGLPSLRRGSHGAYCVGGGSSSRDSSMDGASPLHKRPRVSGLANFLTIGRQAGASVAPLPPLPPRPPARNPSAGRPPATPERALRSSSSSSNSASPSPNPPRGLSLLGPSVSSRASPTSSRMSATPAPTSDAPTPAMESLRLDIQSALAVLHELQVEQGVCQQRSGFKTALEQLLGDVAAAEGASVAARGAGCVDEATARAKLNSVLLEIAPFDKGALLDSGWYATHLPLQASTEQAPPAPEAACSDSGRHSEAAAQCLQPAAALPVRALYADVDQVAAGGELACTCVALEVAVWMDTAASSLPAGARLLTPEVLSELVLRGSSMWRAAKLEAAAGSDGMLEVDVALELRNRRRSVQLCVVQSAFSQVGCEGLLGADTTFPAFAKAASSAAAAAYANLATASCEHCSTAGQQQQQQPAPLLHHSTFLLVASGHSTAVWFLHDGRVLLVNSLGRSLAPSCKHAHALEFSSVDEFCAVYVGMVLPAGAKPAQVEAHKVARQQPAGGAAELLMYMPGG